MQENSNSTANTTSGPAAVTVDDFLPALDRTGKRGRLTTEERQYNARRAALQELLDRLAESEEAVRTARMTEHGLRADLAGATRGNDVLESRLFTVRHELSRTVSGRQRDVMVMRQAMVMVTQIVRLVGWELTNIRCERDAAQEVVVKFGAGSFEFEFRYSTSMLTVSARKQGLRPMQFQVDSNGGIPQKDLLALKTFLTTDPSQVQGMVPAHIARTMFVSAQTPQALPVHGLLAQLFGDTPADSDPSSNGGDNGLSTILSSLLG